MNPNEFPHMTFEEEEFARQAQKSTEETPGVVRLFMKFTGGSKKRAEYFIFILVIFSTLFSLLTIFNSSKIEIDQKYVFNPSNASRDYTNE